MCVCVCVCVRERERGRERDCKRAYRARAGMRVCSCYIVCMWGEGGGIRKRRRGPHLHRTIVKTATQSQKVDQSRRHSFDQDCNLHSLPFRSLCACLHASLRQDRVGTKLSRCRTQIKYQLSNNNNNNNGNDPILETEAITVLYC